MKAFLEKYSQNICKRLLDQTVEELYEKTSCNVFIKIVIVEVKNYNEKIETITMHLEFSLKVWVLVFTLQAQDFQSKFQVHPHLPL